MSYFFRTYETIPPGAGFSQFGLCHLLWLALAAALWTFSCLWYRRAPSGARRRLLLLLAGLMLACEAAKQAILLCTAAFNWSYLPLHLCSVNIFVCGFYALRPRRLAGEFLYAVCLPGAIAALLCPGWMVFPFWNFLHLNSFIIHILLALFPLLLLTGGELSPDARRLPLIFSCLSTAAPFIYWLNKMTGSNFFFLDAPGEGNPLQWFEKLWGNPGYIAGYPILMAAIWTAMYLPIHLRRQKIKTPALAPEAEERTPVHR